MEEVANLMAIYSHACTYTYIWWKEEVTPSVQISKCRQKLCTVI